MRIHRGGGGQGVLTPIEKSQNKGFLCKTGPGPLKNHKAAKPAFNKGRDHPKQKISA